jgi:microcystin-dependent protein
MATRFYSSVATEKTVATNALTNTSTSITFSDKIGLPTAPFTMVLEPDTAYEEIITCTVNTAGNTYTILRGEEQTTAVAHSIGATARHMITARDLTATQTHYDATAAHFVAGVSGAVVGTVGAQTLTNKTLTSPTINTPTITSASITTATISNATLTGTLALPSGSVTGTMIADGTITNADINAAAGIAASKIAVGGAAGSIALGTSASAITADSKTVSAAEVGYLDGVTSPIQTQITTNTPVGTIIMYGASTAPTGWLLCNGATIPTEHTALRALVGNTTPDLMGRVPVGYGNGSGLTNRSTLFFQDGFENVTLTTAQIPSHQHGTAIAGGSSFNMAGSSTAGQYANWFEGNSSNSTIVTDLLIGGGGSHPNMQPFTVVQFIIKF